jgi:hypothetical protein
MSVAILSSQCKVRVSSFDDGVFCFATDITTSEEANFLDTATVVALPQKN